MWRRMGRHALLSNRPRAVQPIGGNRGRDRGQNCNCWKRLVAAARRWAGQRGWQANFFSFPRDS